ncbi:MAG: ATP-binding protein [Bacteroidales bacterium]|nr:ATP-binding protein [Bacteroidales bacterium]
MGKNILFIENNDSEYLRLKNLVEPFGYEAHQANDFDSAMQTLTERHFYAVLIEIDAIQSIGHIDTIIQAAKPYAMVMIKGTEKYEDIICQAIGLGADDFIRTPFSDNILVARSRSVIKRMIEMRNSHSRNLNNLIDFMPVMMLVTDGNSNIISANKTALNKFGKSIEECRGKKVGAFLSCDNAVDGAVCMQDCSLCKIPDMEQEVISTGKYIIRKEVKFNQIRNGKSHKKSVRVSMAPIEYDNQKMVITTIEDITVERNAFEALSTAIDTLQKSYSDSQDQVKISNELTDYLKQINDNLKAEKSKLQMLFDNMSSGFILFHKKDGQILFEEANAKVNELFKADVSKFFGYKLLDIAKTSKANMKFYSALEMVMESGQSAKFDFSAEEFNSSFSVNMYQPEPDYVAVLMNDITDEIRSHQENKMLNRMLKKQNIELDDKNVELKKAVETKNKFISIIAHDLRNPFNAINGLSDMLVKRLNPDTDKRSFDMAKIIHDSAKGAYELLENLLVWARSQQNTIQYQPEMLALHRVAGEAISEILAQAEKKHIMLMNQTEIGGQIWADKQMLLTIIRNITSNAIKFTNEGGLIVIGSDQNEVATTIIIEDNGVGMTQEVIDKLFTVSKNKSTKGTSGESGSGMGLLITKEFVEKHLGTINVESQVGMGSKFIINFPNIQEAKD